MDTNEFEIFKRLIERDPDLKKFVSITTNDHYKLVTDFAISALILSNVCLHILKEKLDISDEELTQYLSSFVHKFRDASNIDINSLFCLF